ncbi:hypothetical protein MUK42_33664 [Musa troglodytarum]|uniref:Uncharacterized protein n=1 Tax=Musa troglodytarum TaxID=320322 RepID=A0A9E7G5K2_9LILI|nr:hypothetical protein MUK42_33664 [Musa troglodytarum]
MTGGRKDCLGTWGGLGLLRCVRKWVLRVGSDFCGTPASLEPRCAEYYLQQMYDDGKRQEARQGEKIPDG